MSDDVMKVLLQTGQMWSRTPEWIFLWAMKLPCAENCFEQISLDFWVEGEKILRLMSGHGDEWSS
jgi:hypothetical protein